MVYDGIILSIVVALIRRGSFRGFASLNLRHGWIFPALLAFQVLVYALQNRVEWVGTVSSYSFMAVYAIGVIFLWLNRKERGFIWILIGVLLNFLVMALNDGRMPVSESAIRVLDPNATAAFANGFSGKHEALTASTRLGFLGDIIPLPKPYPIEQVISIGDIIMSIGIFLYIQQIMLRHRKAASQTGQA